MSSLETVVFSRSIVIYAVSIFQNALHQFTDDPLPRLNLVESLLLLREDSAALDEARRALAVCEAWPGLGAFEGRRLVEPGPRDDETWAWLEQPFPPTPGVMTDEWRRIESAHANDPAGRAEARRTLIRWRLHLIVGELTGWTFAFDEAVLARPDLPLGRTALGCALAREGQVTPDD